MNHHSLKMNPSIKERSALSFIREIGRSGQPGFFKERFRPAWRACFFGSFILLCVGSLHADPRDLNAPGADGAALDGNGGNGGDGGYLRVESSLRGLGAALTRVIDLEGRPGGPAGTDPLNIEWELPGYPGGSGTLEVRNGAHWGSSNDTGRFEVGLSHPALSTT